MTLSVDAHAINAVTSCIVSYSCLLRQSISIHLSPSSSRSINYENSCHSKQIINNHYHHVAFCLHQMLILYTSLPQINKPSVVACLISPSVLQLAILQLHSIWLLPLLYITLSISQSINEQVAIKVHNI